MTLQGGKALLVFVRDPASGPVKTRLSPPFTPRQAADFYRAMAADILAAHAGVDGYDTIVCYTPAEAERSVREWLGDRLILWSQEGKDLGGRMRNAINRALAHGYTKAVVIGTDAPHMPAAAMSDAFELLDRFNAVIGPTEDGGYYVIGGGGSIDPLFEDISWGSDRVLAETIERAESSGTSVAILQRTFDIDTFEDAERLHLIITGSGELGRRAERSMRFLEEYFGDRNAES